MSFFNNLSSLFNTVEADQPEQSGKESPSKSGQKKSRSDSKSNKSSSSQKSKKSSDRQSQKSQRASSKSARKPRTGKSKRQPKVDTDSIVREAQAKAREIIVEAKDEALAIKAKSDEELRQARKDLEDQQRQVNKQLDRIEVKLNQLEDREDKLDDQRDQLTKQSQELDAKRNEVLKRLEEVSSLTKEEATEQLFAGLEKKLSKEMAQFIRQKEEEAHTEAEDKVREILIDSMKHGATDYVPEYTISTVQLPSEDVKGKIIGKNGRNIHAFERVTGVDVDLDSGATEVRLSCFNPVRREIARVSLERLIKDGRIQPARIEEVVAKVTKEIERITFEAGKKLCHDVGVYNLPPQLMQMLGRFKYRFSYGQNLIAHTLEETKIGIKLAHEMGADVNTVKLGCLLHDIGKVSEEDEGSHVELGVKIAKKYNIPQPVIDCIAQHHEDEPFSGVEQMLVYIADAISGARPGARYENHEEYVKRLEQIETIATGYPNVQEAYAIAAGREVRVLLSPEKSKDDDVEVLAVKIRDEIKEAVTYPGTVTVTVIREKRGKQIAK